MSEFDGLSDVDRDVAVIDMLAERLCNVWYIARFGERYVPREWHVVLLEEQNAWRAITDEALREVPKLTGGSRDG